MKTFIMSVLASVAVGFAAGQELKIEVTKAVQCDRKTKSGDTIEVNYNGTLTDGKAFDSSYNGKVASPFSFTLGLGDVIKGWDLGLLDMCIGDRRTLTLPPRYGYGNRAVGPVPANSTLIFYTELVGIEGVASPPKLAV